MSHSLVVVGGGVGWVEGGGGFHRGSICFKYAKNSDYIRYTECFNILSQISSPLFSGNLYVLLYKKYRIFSSPGELMLSPSRWRRRLSASASALAHCLSFQRCA